MLTIALSKGRILDDTLPLLAAAGIAPTENPEKSRKLIIPTTLEDVRLLIVRATDVPTYVEKGTADLGIVGRDVLMEHPAKVYEMLNLDIGRCRMCVAGYPGTTFSYNRKLTVGSKYINIAKQYFDSIDQPADLIEINGSVELAPVLGLSDVIVDIVETGDTLRENGLDVLTTICEISSRLIVNQVSLKTKTDAILPVIEAFEQAESGD